MDSFYSKLDFRSPKENALLSGSGRRTQQKVKSSDDFKFQFSLGGGVRFYNQFIYADPILNADIGFRLSKHFVLSIGAEFWIYKYTNYDEGYGVKETKLLTSLFVAPLFYLEAKKFMFYTGGGAGWTFPSNVGSLHFFLLTRAGYKITEGVSTNVSITLPMYFNGKIEGLSASVMFTFLF